MCEKDNCLGTEALCESVPIESSRLRGITVVEEVQAAKTSSWAEMIIGTNVLYSGGRPMRMPAKRPAMASGAGGSGDIMRVDGNEPLSIIIHFSSICLLPYQCLERLVEGPPRRSLAVATV